jgi:hypothetical protein
MLNHTANEVVSRAATVLHLHELSKWAESGRRVFVQSVSVLSSKREGQTGWATAINSLKAIIKEGEEKAGIHKETSP